MAINFEIVDETTTTVTEPGSYFILIDRNERGWGAKGYFNGGANIMVGHKYSTYEAAYYALKDKVASAAGKLLAVEM
ncbi:hypothetical protein EW589_19865 [Salmonella enterica subsp. enterica serovar Typhimurium]|nr:hypothetical protein [Salmonella enterica subsp. enterica serovar Typhimurium]EBB4839337.1 hypothetical protein [Salmonella enterica subsp. enterica serovar Typhimurium]